MLPIHNHSEYSALDGYSHTSEIAARIEQLGLPGAFLTDHGTVAGLGPFAKAMKAKNLFVGYGMEAYQARDSRLNKKGPTGKGFRKGEDAFHLILLAKTPEGYRNLMRISDDSHRTGFHYDPRVDWVLLDKYKEGLICTTACMGSLPSQDMMRGDTKSIERLHKIFRDDFFIEISTYDTDEQRNLNLDLVDVAYDRSIPLLYANDAHYARPEQWEVHEALLCAQYNERLEGEKKYSNFNVINEQTGEDIEYHHPPCLYIMDEAEVVERLSHLPEWAVEQAIANSDMLMETCAFELDKPGLYLPKFKVPEDYTDSADMLEALVVDGLQAKYDPITSEVMDRAMFEFNAIVDAGLQDYFLIVHDYINYALSQGVMVGPGRGSVGGSILAYALGITAIDPLKFNLQFERFWNPGRADGLPDIDIDFERSSRQYMIEYVKKHYGEDRVLPIGNHIFIRPKSAIDKAGMVLYENPPFGVLVKIKQIIETTVDAGQQPGWDEMMEMVGDELEPYIRKFPELFDLAALLAGRISTYGVHASAVVISAVDLDGRLPARMASDDDDRKVLVTQAEMKEVEKEGFPKFDFLGLRNLDTIMMTAILSGDYGDPDVLGPKLMKLIDERNQGSVERMDKDLRTALTSIIAHFRDEVNYDMLPDSFWELIDNGNTLGLFQVEESASPIRIGKHLRPRNLEDLALIVALNRPGPLRDRDDRGRSTVDRFLARRNGEEEARFPHPILEASLGVTYGDFLYQEQVIGYFREIGYSLSDADHIRKMLGKKLVSEMKKEFPTYLKYAEEHMPRQTAETIWKSIEDFSKYSFNKAHAVGYGMILAWTMYAKWKWPVEFIMASITTAPKKMASYVNEARRMKVAVRPPSAIYSDVTISKHNDEIYFGIRDIKGIGDDAAKWVVEHRPYSSPEDFYRKCVADKPIVVKANHRQAMMDAGMFDSFGYRLAKCEPCEGKGRRRIDPTKRILDDCPDCEGIGYAKTDLPDDRTRVAQEEELLRIALTDINTDLYDKYADEIAALDPLSAADVEEKTLVKVPGVVTAIDKRKVKEDATYNAGKEWARVTIMWNGEEASFAAWPQQYEKFGYMLKPQVFGWFKLQTGPKGAQLKEGKKFL
jgi:DNA polymerase III subunit alpha